MSIRTRRICPGHYEVDTPLGTFQVDQWPEDEYVTNDWFITWPGQNSPDGVAWTLREAKRQIAHEVRTEATG